MQLPRTSKAVVIKTEKRYTRYLIINYANLELRWCEWANNGSWTRRTHMPHKLIGIDWQKAQFQSWASHRTFLGIPAHTKAELKLAEYKWRVSYTTVHSLVFLSLSHTQSTPGWLRMYACFNWNWSMTETIDMYVRHGVCAEWIICIKHVGA